MARTIKQLPVNAARFDESTGYLRIVASTETPDRDDEVVVPSTIRLDTYKRNPVVLWAHDQEKLPIGKSRCELDGDGNLIAEFHFADTDASTTGGLTILISLWCPAQLCHRHHIGTPAKSKFRVNTESSVNNSSVFTGESLYSYWNHG